MSKDTSAPEVEKEEEDKPPEPAPVRSWIEKVMLPKSQPPPAHKPEQRPVPNKPNMRKLLFQREPKKKEERPKRQGPNVLIDILRGR